MHGLPLNNRVIREACHAAQSGGVIKQLLLGDARRAAGGLEHRIELGDVYLCLHRLTYCDAKASDHSSSARADADHSAARQLASGAEGVHLVARLIQRTAHVVL